MATNSHEPLRWGILSTARIGRTNWRAMRDSGAATLVAVASRDLSKAEVFIAEMQRDSPWPQTPLALGSYEELLAHPAIDAIYIPLPTGIRKEWVLRAAEAGKHVLCEKPCAVSAEDLREMLAACNRHGVHFMDGVMFMHDPRFEVLRGLLDAGEEIGEIKRITSAFSFLGGEDFSANNIRATTRLEPTGCLGDLGWYCLRASLWAMNWEMPSRICGRVLGAAATILEFSAELDFAGGATAAFHCSFLIPGEKWLQISGTKGHLRVPDFVAPVNDTDTAWQIGHRRVDRATEPGMSNEARMFVRFAADVRGDAEIPPWPEISLKTQILLDACALSGRIGRPVFLNGDRYV